MYLQPRRTDSRAHSTKVRKLVNRTTRDVGRKETYTQLETSPQRPRRSSQGAQDDAQTGLLDQIRNLDLSRSGQIQSNPDLSRSGQVRSNLGKSGQIRTKSRIIQSWNRTTGRNLYTSHR